MKDIMLVEAEIWTVARTDKGNAVLVRPVGGDRAVPIFIGQAEAQSILFGLASVPVPRPMTHDLFLSVLGKTGVSVERVEITDLKDRTFYSRLILKQGMKEVVVDSRPSDSLGIASRIHCPVFIAESIVDETGVAVAHFADDEDGAEQAEEAIVDDVRSRLESDLQSAVEREDYEEAARIRDRIKEL